MASTFERLAKKGLVSAAPRFLVGSIHYEVIMGSMAYGVSNDSSDVDVYGFAIPPKDDMFPHLRGEIPGFDECAPKFQQFQQHHIHERDALGGAGREVDLTIYSIAKYFRLLAENNPNIIDSLFVPKNCILHCTNIGQMLLDNRMMFIHKGCWAKFKGYAYGQMHKLRTKQPEGNRKAMLDKFGYDVKFAYHIVRLLDEVEQLLTEHNLVLGRNKEQLKAIRRGEWTLAQLEQYFADKERSLEGVYSQSTLPAKIDTNKVRTLLMQCVEQHFGSVDGVVRSGGDAEQLLLEIKQMLDRY